MAVMENFTILRYISECLNKNKCRYQKTPHCTIKRALYHRKSKAVIKPALLHEHHNKFMSQIMPQKRETFHVFYQVNYFS